LHARGFSLPRVWAMHLLPNAIAPVITQTGMLFGELLAGAIVTETIFGLNGLGRLAGQAVANQDVAVMQSIILLTAIVFVIVTFLVEIILFRLDVRNRAFLPKRKTA
ncbi:MAG: ABC transporter permease subunit, partial [Acetobacter orientalis]